MPGTDPAEAMRLVVGELPDLPHLPELPGRGPGAGLTGRTAALLVDMPAELTASGWRFTVRPGRDLRRARDLLSADLDALEEAAAGYRGPLKVQAAGPWTLAATVELIRSQERALADPGAVADLTESLSEGLRSHLEEVRKRVPGAQLLLQLDEPSLPGVLAGELRSASGLYRLPPPETADVENRLGAVIAATAVYSIVHCCAMSVPFGIIKGAGANAIGFDLDRLSQRGEEALAETVEAGLGILAGVVPAVPGPAAGPEPGSRAGQQPAPVRAVAERVIELWRRMGWPAASGAAAPGRSGVARQVVLTPGCGLAGALPGYAREALARCQQAARLL
ncbi:MAG: methionine synthase, partial [Actinobacteria bacterium]|nr:methionine synthase [Actinomycetota bacterium]